MLNQNSIMIGTSNPKALAKFYEKVFKKKPDMQEGTWYGWNAGNSFISIGEHSKVKGKSKEPARIIINFETKEVKKEFKRIKALKAKVIEAPYDMDGAWVATFADPDGNYFQLMSPWRN